MYGKYSRAGHDGACTVVQILVQSHFDLVNSVLALESDELVSEPVMQMAVRSASSFAR